MKHMTIKIIAFVAVCIVGWHIGGMIPDHTMTLFFGFIFGSFVGIPAMLIIATRAQTVRHDHYIHTSEEAPVKAPVVPTRRITVVNPPSLPIAQNKVEVSR